MIKLGFCVEDFGPSQLSYSILKSCNDYLIKNNDISVYGFYENLHKPVFGPAFGIFSLAEVYGFDGILITTTAHQTYQTLKWPKPTKRIYYVNQLEWGNNIPYEYFASIFRSGVEIVTRSEDYAKLIRNGFNIDCKVNENFNLKEFV